MQSQKLFLQLNDSDYNAGTGRYTIDIQEQDIRNPKTVVFESVTAKLSTDDDYLFIHSNALASIAKQRPAALNTQYGDCVYVLHPEQRIVRDEVSTTTVTSSLSDDDVLNLSDLFMFLNWDSVANILPPLITLGDNITNIQSMLNSNFLFTTSSAGLEYAAFGATHGMKSTVNWHYAYDNSAANNPNEGLESTLSMMFRTKPVLSGFNWIMKSTLFQLTTGAALGSSNVMGFYDSDSSAWMTTGLLIQGGTDYFLQVKKTSTSNFVWLLRDLSTNIEQSETSGDSASQGVSNQTVYLANAQTGFLDMTLSHYVQVSNTTDADGLTVKNWMLGKYNGDSTTDTIITHPNSYQVFSKHKKIVPCRHQSTTLHELDLQFTNASNAVVKPLSGIIELLIKS